MRFVDCYNCQYIAGIEFGYDIPKMPSTTGSVEVDIVSLGILKAYSIPRRREGFIPAEGCNK